MVSDSLEACLSRRGRLGIYVPITPLSCWGAVRSRIIGEMRLIKSILILSICVFSAMAASADDPKFDLGKTKSKRNKNPLDLLVLEMQMGESGYRVSQSLDNKGRLLVAYEKAVNEFCFQSLRSGTTYMFDRTNTKCSDQIAKIVALDASNPPAICARDGIDSTTCDLAFSGQKLGLFNVFADANSSAANPNDNAKVIQDKLLPPTLSEQLQLQEQLRGKQVEGQIDGLKGRYRTAYANYSRTKKGEDRATVELALTNWIKSACGGSEVRYISSAKTLSRVRLLTSGCLDAVSQGRAFDKNFVPAVCAQDGFYTPSCTKARRLRALTLKPKTKVQPTVTPGLSTF